MIRGLYIAQSGMHMNERMQEVVTNNIANANTVGYKGESGVVRSFPEQLLYRINDLQKGGEAAGQHRIGALSAGVFLEEIVPRFVQGQLIASDNPHARAIVDGPPRDQDDYARAFFPVVERNSGQVMYTRDGDFQVEPGTNFLIDTGGNYVVPVDQTSHNAMGNLRIRVTDDGEYQVTNANGQAYVPPQGTGPVNQGIVYIEDSNQLEKYGDTLFQGGTVVTDNAEFAQLSSTVSAKQLEQSNVDLASSMVSMMQVMRTYEANQKMIRTLDSTLEKATTIGRL